MYQADMHRDNLAPFLTEKIAELMRSYNRLLEQEPPISDLAGHKLWNAACKAALTHIELMVRMVRQIDRAEQETAGAQGGGSSLGPGELERAKADLAAFGEDEEDG